MGPTPVTLMNNNLTNTPGYSRLIALLACAYFILALSPPLLASKVRDYGSSASASDSGSTTSTLPQKASGSADPEPTFMDQYGLTIQIVSGVVLVGGVAALILIRMSKGKLPNTQGPGAQGPGTGS